MPDPEVWTTRYLGEKTVKVHRARVTEKMRARSLAELVRLADEAGVTVPKT
ncbi:MAG: LuxR C-terminal-related transcriptional regulator [Candidatus Rokuibacteriota bacterium]